MSRDRTSDERQVSSAAMKAADQPSYEKFCAEVDKLDAFGRLIRVTLEDGNTITTRINGTDEDIMPVLPGRLIPERRHRLRRYGEDRGGRHFDRRRGIAALAPYSRCNGLLVMSEGRLHTRAWKIGIRGVCD